MYIYGSRIFAKRGKLLSYLAFVFSFFFFGLNRDLSKFFHMLRFHVMICDRRSKIIIFYNNKCPTGYTIKLRYTDAWYDYVIKGTDARL